MKTRDGEQIQPKIVFRIKIVCIIWKEFREISDYFQLEGPSVYIIVNKKA